MNLSTPSTTIFLGLFDNEVLTWGLIACGLAQLSKLVFELLNHGKWRPGVLFETGGMPSSHAALVTGTTSGLGLDLGFDDPVFALAATIAFIVMYDASGIRRAAGQTASMVNKLINTNESANTTKTLKENLGHTRTEVIVGSLLGPTVALPGIVFIGSPVDLIHTIHSAIGSIL
tara:strand:+ start:34080 stop:34601 length:522 start_codon:yes stop_codon:yes gene_type:complete